MASQDGVATAPSAGSLPTGIRIRLNNRTKGWAEWSMLIGGAPWRISRLAQAAGELASRVASAGSAGLVLNQEAHLRIARVLLDRGLVDPMPADLDPPGAF